ncbi:MAG: toxin HicA [Rhodanobacteraceae bacterium]|nr:MAG: toxin HicA [Rhodanobacteraceae bacterium]
MDRIARLVQRMRDPPRNVGFADLARVCDHCFGRPRQRGTSHRVYRTPWAGDPRVNVQRGAAGMAKAYQVRQVLTAIDRLERES